MRPSATDFAITSSMADGLLAHLAGRASPGVNVVFLDTGYHFAETIGTRDAVARVLPIDVRTSRRCRRSPSRTPTYGRTCRTATPTCAASCARSSRSARRSRRSSPGAPGMRRDESPTRARHAGRRVGRQAGMVKVNPLAAWTQDDVDAYIAEQRVLVNPLCPTATARSAARRAPAAVAPGEDPRAGRWAGSAKTECGIHT